MDKEAMIELEKQVDKILIDANLNTKNKLNWFDKNVFRINPKHTNQERELYLAFARVGFFVGEKYACDKILKEVSSK